MTKEECKQPSIQHLTKSNVFGYPSWDIIFSYPSQDIIMLLSIFSMPDDDEAVPERSNRSAEFGL